MADDIYVNLFKLAVRTLIRELHIYKEKGLLKGETKEARFSYFEMLCEKQEFRDVFFQKYSQLEQILDDYVTCLTRNLIKMISDTIDDRTRLEEVLGVKIDSINDISIGKGDTHNGAFLLSNK